MTFEDRQKFEEYFKDVLAAPFSSDANYTGSKAIFETDDINSNPYPVGSFEWYEWIDGFLDCDVALNPTTALLIRIN